MTTEGATAPGKEYCPERIDCYLGERPCNCRAERENRWLRRKLCAVYAGPLAYMDDGEAQDGREHPFIDFLRDTPEEIDSKMLERFARAARAPKDST